MKKKLTNLRRLIFFYVIWRIAFKIGSLLPSDNRLILFAFSKNYTEMPDNLSGIYAYLKDKGYNCMIMQSPQNAVKRIIFDVKFQVYYARCKCVFVTDNFDPLYSNKPNSGTRVVQLWHACGAFKKWGYSTLDLKWGGSREDMLRFPMHNTYTDVFVSSEEVIPCYAEAFGCKPEIIKALGTPRTDIYFDSEFLGGCRNEILKNFPEIGDRKIILYAPTFRGNSPESSYNDIKLDFRKLKAEFGDDCVIALKLHPFTAKKVRLSDSTEAFYGDFVFDITSVNIETCLGAADILIADYSSLIFEYALLNKPMIFYAYDLEEYDRDRSFYYDYNSFVPGTVVKTTEEIIETLKSGNFGSEKIPLFREKFMSACDGNCVCRIADYCVR